MVLSVDMIKRKIMFKAQLCFHFFQMQEQCRNINMEKINAYLKCKCINSRASSQAKAFSRLLKRFSNRIREIKKTKFPFPLGFIYILEIKFFYISRMCCISSELFRSYSKTNSTLSIVFSHKKIQVFSRPLRLFSFTMLIF